jgi:hypothetical protein
MKFRKQKATYDRVRYDVRLPMQPIRFDWKRNVYWKLLLLKSKTDFHCSVSSWRQCVRIVARDFCIFDNVNQLSFDDELTVHSRRLLVAIAAVSIMQFTTVVFDRVFAFRWIPSCFWSDFCYLFYPIVEISIYTLSLRTLTPTCYAHLHHSLFSLSPSAVSFPFIHFWTMEGLGRNRAETSFDPARRFRDRAATQPAFMVQSRTALTPKFTLRNPGQVNSTLMKTFRYQ